MDSYRTPLMTQTLQSNWDIPCAKGKHNIIHQWSFLPNVRGHVLYSFNGHWESLCSLGWVGVFHGTSRYGFIKHEPPKACLGQDFPICSSLFMLIRLYGKNKDHTSPVHLPRIVSHMTGERQWGQPSVGSVCASDGTPSITHPATQHFFSSALGALHQCACLHLPLPTFSHVLS